MQEPPEREEDPAPDALRDRRRRGRVDYQNRGLIALLRQQWREPAEPAHANEETDGVDCIRNGDLQPFRGVTIAVMGGAVVWAAIAALVWWLRR
jgi:hypothetical protein